MPYLTPDTIPATTVCRVLHIPDSEDWVAIVTGAIQELSFEYNWEEFGLTTPNDCAEAMFTMLNELIDDKAGCRMIGEIIPYAGTSSPTSLWLMCNGQELLRTEYPDLFNVIGTTFGASDLQHFNIPDLRGQVIMHQGNGYSYGVAVGEATHTLTSGEMPAHSHTVTGHVHTTGNSLTGLALAPGELPVLVPNPIPALTGTGFEGINIAGSGGAHNNIQPSMPLSYLIVAKDRE